MNRIAIPVSTNECCSYGCGNPARFINKSKKLMCSDRSTKCPAIREKNRRGAKDAYASGKRDSSKARYEGLPQATKDRMAWSRGKILSVDFSYGGKGQHKKALIEERGHWCECCNNSTWLDEPIPLELEHCDGDNKNNTKENLLLLCPNCHAKTRYYRGRNINTGKIKVTDEQIKEQIDKGLNTRQILLAVGLTPKGANYDRVNKLIVAA